MKYKKGTNKFISSRYYYEVIVGIHTKEDDIEDDITRNFTIVSDNKMSSDDVIESAVKMIRDLVDKQEDFYQYKLVIPTGVTILGAYDQEL